jgi:phosphate transport system protein
VSSANFGIPGPRDETGVGPRGGFDRSVASLKRRLVQEGTAAVGMLEAALDALWRLDIAKAREVRRSDDRIDREEVEIEQECFRLLTLQAPFARDFRVITFAMKVNNDFERVADHASSIAKVTMRLTFTEPPRWPTALVEMGQRVTVMCHSLLRAVLDEDSSVAARIVGEDKTIDALEKRLFEETEELMRSDPAWVRHGLLIYRLGRELERIGDLLKNIAEDVIYLATGSIVRHEAKRITPGGTPATEPPPMR